MIDKLLILVPLLPLTAAVCVALFGRRLKEWSHVPVAVGIGLSFLFSVMLLLEVRNDAHERQGMGIGYEHTFTLWTWADVTDAYRSEGALPANAATPLTVPSPPAIPPSPTNIAPTNPAPPVAYNFDIGVTLRADPLTCIMLSMVTFVSTLVTIYAAGYMHGDRGYWRFFAYIGLFVFSMTMLVSVSNFVLLYVFWEAVGACSYLLIGFWYQKPEAAAAGKKAFLVNRIGDFGFALALFLIWTSYGSLNFHDTYRDLPTGETVLSSLGVLGQTRLSTPEMFLGGGVAVAICLLLMLGACGKSAQFPLHVWLPDAMEGPTPVSALIHAATMVTAGVYMVVRCTPLFLAAAGAPWLEINGEPIDAQNAVAMIGGFTALLAGLIALTQNDLKRVLAYSTVSQLGYMFLSVGTGSLLGITAGMFHLFTHAFFKALLFLGAGSVMHAMGGVIDMRRFGGLRQLMPTTFQTFRVGCLALAGVVPFAGFWSKDEILAALHERGHADPSVVQQSLYTGLYWLAVFTAGLTAFYTFRAFFLTFYGKERVPAEAGHHAHESPPSMTVPLIVLAVCSLVVGWFFAWTHGFAEFLHKTPSLSFVQADFVAPHFHWNVAVTSTLVALSGIGLAAYLYLGHRGEVEYLAQVARPLYLLSYGKFFFDPIYNLLIVWPLRALAFLCYAVDRGIIDGLVNLLGWIPALLGRTMRSLQNGMVQFYALAMVLGLLVLVAALVMRPGG